MQSNLSDLLSRFQGKILQLKFLKFEYKPFQRKKKIGSSDLEYQI